MTLVLPYTITLEPTAGYVAPPTYAVYQPVPVLGAVAQFKTETVSIYVKGVGVRRSVGAVP